LHQLTLL
jgi:Mitochondrial carrier protein